MLFFGISRLKDNPIRLIASTQKEKHLMYTVVVLATIFGGIRLNLIFFALSTVPMALVHVVLNGSPVMVLVISHFMLGNQDRITRLKVTGASFLIIGLLLAFEPWKHIMSFVSTDIN